MDSRRLKVSMAMASYNAERYIEAQLESILGQTRPVDELIISDDGSTDKTIEIIERVTAGYSGVRLLRNEQTVLTARNFENAIRETTGDVIFLSDTDDVWFPDKVAAMIQPFNADTRILLAYCNAVLTDRELRPIETMFERRKESGLGQPLTISQMVRGVPFNGPMIAFRAELKPYVIPISPLSLQWFHDHWIAFIAYAVGQVKSIDEPYVYYRRHGANLGGDADLDGGLWYQWKVVKSLYSGGRGLNGYRDRRRGWEDMVTRLREIRDTGMPVQQPGHFDELLRESESSLRFARTREELKAKTRSARALKATALLCEGGYHHHARGIKTFVQDVLIP